MAVTIRTEGAFRHDMPVPLFGIPEILAAPWTYQTFDTAPDGRRFLILLPWKDPSIEKGTVTLVQGWRGLLD